jgi:flagellar basal-body rod protein FlgG
MLSAVRAAISGMLAHKVRIDVIGNNLANVNTPGFKQTRAEFRDLPYEAMPNSQPPPGVELRLGSGSQLLATQRMFLQGAIQQTGNPTDFALYGDGFFAVQTLDGSTAYTRDGAFRVDAEGQLVTPHGERLVPPIALPAGFKGVHIREDGQVSVDMPDETVPRVVGQIQLTRFTNPNGLISTGEGLLRPTDASGPAIDGAPGDIGFGRVVGGAVEGSTVELADEMTQLVLAQRAYEMNSRAFTTLDQMVGKLTEFRR